MDVRTVRDSDAATVISALLLCLIKSYFDIWNSASRASLTSSKEINFLLSISTTIHEGYSLVTGRCPELHLCRYFQPQ